MADRPLSHRRVEFAIDDARQAEREAIAQALEREVQEMARASLGLYDHADALDSAVLRITLLVSRIRRGEVSA